MVMDDKTKMKKYKQIVICYFIFSVVFAILSVIFTVIMFAIYSIVILFLATLDVFRIFYYYATKPSKKEES
jgi:hypothetical protein